MQPLLLSSFPLIYSSFPPSSILLPPSLPPQLEKSRKDLEAYYSKKKDEKQISSDLPQNEERFLEGLVQGVGRPLSIENVKIIIALKILELSQGMSGVGGETVAKLVEGYNKGVWPWVGRKNGCSASDLNTSLAQIIYGLTGKGKVYDEETKTFEEAQKVFAKKNFEPLKLNQTELLGLISGNKNIVGEVICVVKRMERLITNALNIFIMSFEAMIANPAAFTGKVHDIRNHVGQIEVAKFIRNSIKENQNLSEQHNFNISKQRLQDSYSFRCVSQILGISFEMFDKLKSILNQEINKVSTVPVVFGEEDVLFAGNFSDFNLVSVLDMTNLSINEIGTLSDRRINRFNNPLLFWGGVKTDCLGFSFNFENIQSVSSTLVSENKSIAQFGSFDITPFRMNQGDFYSNGSYSVEKSKKLIKNITRILALEALIASKQILSQKPLKSLENIQAKCEKIEDLIKEKRNLSEKMNIIYKYLEDNEL